MRITIQDDNDVVFDSDGRTVLMAADPSQRAFIFHMLTASLAMLCNVKPLHEVMDDASVPEARKQ